MGHVGMSQMPKDSFLTDWGMIKDGGVDRGIIGRVISGGSCKKYHGWSVTQWFMTIL